MKVKTYRLQNPVNLKIYDKRALYLLWHFFNNAESVGKGGFKESVVSMASHLETVAKDWHQSSRSTDLWAHINDLCDQARVDVKEPLELWEAPPLPTLSSKDDTYTVSMPDPDTIKVGCKLIPLSEIKKLVSVLLDEKVIEFPKAE